MKKETQKIVIVYDLETEDSNNGENIKVKVSNIRVGEDSTPKINEEILAQVLFKVANSIA